ncbi:FAD-dependent oxidoreductase [Pseudomonas lalucatii]|uniref:FAD-dependent oxidoreductase n=1 Tax=Pseudomonas lalucatii TaxID=1424203 RepID=A0ABS5Q4C0_9PSED|nr:FAD-dependent oxidoreductase [Pseudomonas lalucatii]MBS7663606.1 FAD-dependent oxidoreductase [Pseudomonas lalucatii]MBS7725112.1 FAD-dependent oxidoreductase [Pseudomonas lalucatii]QVM86922.1 FAD-dependent oxidoreductase [Pseudomonas lalucatii]
MTRHVVIVGAGHGGVSLASALRSQHFDGSITLLSDEGDLPYHRPPLSKAFICSDTPEVEEKLLLQSRDFYDQQRIDLRLGVRVSALVPDARQLILDDGSRLAYDDLVLATGARARPLPLPGCDLQGVVRLRTLAQARDLRQRLAQSNAVVVVGGGFIGLELAATARQLGKQVTVLETAGRIMERSVSPQVSAYVTAKHREKGIDIELSSTVQAFLGEHGRVSAVRGASGEWPADLVIVGAGALPNSELAEAAGIACANGILVDNHLRTSAPRVYAIGDCVACENRYADNARLRLESIQNANDQARIVAQQILGQDARYEALPWFWSDQGEIKLQMVGLSLGCTDYVTRGDPGRGRFSVFHYRDEILIAVDSVNQPLDHVLSRKLLAAGISPDKTQVADTGFDLKSLLA